MASASCDQVERLKEVLPTRERRIETGASIGDRSRDGDLGGGEVRGEETREGKG